jgi:hypothetical protein
VSNAIALVLLCRRLTLALARHSELYSYFNGIYARNFALNVRPVSTEPGTPKPAAFAFEATASVRSNWFFRALLLIFVNCGASTSFFARINQNMARDQR